MLAGTSKASWCDAVRSLGAAQPAIVPSDLNRMALIEPD